MLKNKKDIFLLVSVFMTGAAVLIIEILAMRIISPYFGNTIFTTSSVIGTVLTALSLGYYFGGRFSDKYPHYFVFYFIILVSGLLVVFMQFLTSFILPIFGALFSMKSGPIISSLFIFFIPAFVLGLLSPFAVKLHKKPSGSSQNTEGDQVGSQSGEVFFWSTLGSIAGTLLAGFVLIPLFGINAIIIATGVFLFLWGAGGFFFLDSLKKHFSSLSYKYALLPFLILAFVLLFVLFYWPQKTAGVIYQKDGVYEKIKIVDGEWNGSPTRFLFQDRSYSAAMYLQKNELVYDYTKYYTLYKLFNPNATKAFVIGGGAYSIPKALLEESEDMQVDVAEIEPDLLALSKKYFNFNPDNRLQDYTEDGRRFLSQNQKKYDILISDVYYSLFSIPMHFTTKEFFNLSKSRLEDNGVFIGNFGGNLYGDSSVLIMSEIKTFKEVFPNSYFFAVNSPKSQNIQNIIFLGINSNQKIDFNSNEIVKNNNTIINGLAQKNIKVDDIDFSQYKELTDNFAPIEYLVGKIID
ncbi:MAG: hypothetical protein A3D34_03460 [Candidatus Staskawiczbacteria bacterium RIFCSPHIGHO2_02_FULL_33_16]|uniref:PABS domain-containing protein n=1 Tax=Candidatus Staskawiczbacteria bacterium RIFCSPHIGHO2_02_FULL_33_16 TaxID=1802204 RepID=A0A1G2HT68_9BACT|nr:MAG: hypothetical protein A3D34_03460 [Candidatus Staskawiczbacteria bacterium RIFCSPHIGHO2_02_FULL_33_16]OGZ70287.1 MAG: hypothetical protein A2980_01950 [Candidatus Staskawiczbacteria bacterium RIFCSPLOWO2_01_FULL_33_13]